MQARKPKNRPNRFHRFFVAFLIFSLFGIIGSYLLKQTNAQSTLSTGTLTLAGSTSDCPSNASSCTKFAVNCPATNLIATGVIAEGNATGTTRGVVGLFTGSRGDSFYGGNNPSQSAYQLVTNLQADGFKTYQVKWDSSWVTVASGLDAGSSKAACRPATVIKWLHDNKFAPLGISPNKIGKCGFCITGNSGGSAQVSYAISHYGLDSILDGVIPTGGPPWAAIAKGCTGSGNEFYANAGPRMLIDESYGYTSTSGGGPCHQQDTSFISRWNNESIESSGSDYHHATTRVHFILGDSDLQQIAHSGYYHDRLKSASTPYVQYQIVANVGHSVQNSAQGASAIRTALLADTGVAVTQTSTPPPTPTQTSSSSNNTSNSTSQTSDSPATQTVEADQKVTTEENKEESNAQPDSVKDVPRAALAAVLNPSRLTELTKGPYSWLVLSLSVTILCALAFGAWKGIQLISKHHKFKEFITLINNKLMKK